MLFTTVPGVTGLLLLLVLLALFASSLESVRRRKYQLFANTHVFLVPAFLVLLVLHGSDGWLNDGYPFSLWFVVPALLLYAQHRLRRSWVSRGDVFTVRDVHFTSDRSFALLLLDKPPNYRFTVG